MGAQLPLQQSFANLQVVFADPQLHDPFTQLPLQQSAFAPQLLPRGLQHVPRVQVTPKQQSLELAQTPPPAR